MMKFLRQLVAAFLAATLIAQPVLAQSILRDAETETLFRDMSAPMIAAAGLNPKSVDIVMIGDGSINAFVAGGQVVYIHSGLIQAADNANEVQGVIAHELGHVAAGDVLRSSAGASEATGITLLSLLLGAAAIAAGAGDAGAGILMAGQQAAMGKYLAFSRSVEAGADESARRYLSASKISGKGMISFFKKLRAEEYRLSQEKIDPYAVTHPLSGDRVAILSERMAADPAWNTPTDPAIEARFQRVKAKLFGFVNDPKDTLVRFPVGNNSIPARYARAYAFHKQSFADKAVAETDALLATIPHDPYFEELKGQILLESGRPREAIPVLRDAVKGTNYQPLIAALFAHSLIATEDKAFYPEAKTVLRNAVQRDRENPFAWYQLGVIYSQEGDTARAALASAERFDLTGQAPQALYNARIAMAGIPKGSSDWIRAQDILMVAQNQVGKDGKRRKPKDE
ncbi:M48 family metalloprotease [Sphingomonas sp. SUN039]|uniref:M48 family metalloprotease n=1 Tax=Sphingomonas sp. SUN039 TaxID=2937787 RepID=UPI002164B370|nr:M48 family metalloprotease [Sphingomonas sp. SUN039]UVO55643.1 M48 family metalloprotease [Sphingomonas sp. SUN039]